MLSSMFKASDVIELSFFSEGNVWSVVISFYLPVLGISLHKFSLQKIPFHHGTYTYQNVNKTPTKIENVNDDGNK